MSKYYGGWGKPDPAVPRGVCRSALPRSKSPAPRMVLFQHIWLLSVLKDLVVSPNTLTDLARQELIGNDCWVFIREESSS